jgi:hypothetical protein
VSAIEKDTKRQYQEFKTWFDKLEKLMEQEPSIHLVSQYQDRMRKYMSLMWCSSLEAELRETLKSTRDGKITIFELDHLLHVTVLFIRYQLKELSELGSHN